VARDSAVEGGKPNPFLHLSMHLSITEQVAANASSKAIADAAGSSKLVLAQQGATRKE
jgi:hypothetical protein